jgi:hypothetical protein
MGRIFFLSAMAFLAYKYIARSNKQHQPLDSAKKGVEVLPPAPAPEITAQTQASIAAEPQPKLVGAGSRAAEPEPRR